MSKIIGDALWSIERELTDKLSKKKKKELAILKKVATMFDRLGDHGVFLVDKKPTSCSACDHHEYMDGDCRPDTVWCMLEGNDAKVLYEGRNLWDKTHVFKRKRHEKCPLTDLDSLLELEDVDDGCPVCGDPLDEIGMAAGEVFNFDKLPDGRYQEQWNAASDTFSQIKCLGCGYEIGMTKVIELKGEYED